MQHTPKNTRATNEAGKETYTKSVRKKRQLYTVLREKLEQVGLQNGERIYGGDYLNLDYGLIRIMATIMTKSHLHWQMRPNEEVDEA